MARNTQIRVTSLDELKRFRASLVQFAESGRNAVGIILSDLQRTRAWVEQDRLPFWLAEVRRRHKAMVAARDELHRKELSKKRCTEEIRAVERAKVRLREAEEKLQVVKRWASVIGREIDSRLGLIQQLDTLFDQEARKALSRVDGTVAAVESYLAVRTGSAEESASSREKKEGADDEH